MHKLRIIISLIALIAAGCHRPTTITSTYTVPALDSEQKAATLQKILNTKLPGALHSIETDIPSRTVTVSFDEQLCRKMNMELVIAEAGFTVNHRPGHLQTRKN